MRPRSAQITESIEGASGNFYPRVSEATIQSIARIPDGHSLVVGGFYGEVESKDNNKVPFLGDIPISTSFLSRNKPAKRNRASCLL